jgi:tetratricopeptide (TPR) repeat protein
MAIFRSNSDVRRLAIGAQEKGKHVAAIVVLNECLRLNPADSFGWLVLSDAHRAINNLSRSADALANALDYADESHRWIVEIRLATLAIVRGRFDEAENWFRRASSAEDARGQRWPLILRGANLIKLERHAEAEAILKEAVVMEGEVDELDEAHHTLGTALEVDPNCWTGFGVD